MAATGTASEVFCDAAARRNAGQSTSNRILVSNFDGAPINLPQVHGRPHKGEPCLLQNW